MTDPGDVLKALGAKDDSEGIKAVEVIGGLIATITNVASFIPFFISLFTSEESNFDITAAFQTIQDDFSVVFNAQSTEDQTMRMIDVANNLESARAIRDEVIANQGKLSVDTAQAYQLKSYTVVKTLGNLAYWRRLHFRSADYYDGWSGILSPVGAQEGGPVFDYRLTLPAYLEAVSIWLFVLATTKPSFLMDNRAEIRDVADVMFQYYTQIREGIAETRQVTFDDARPSVWPFQGSPQPGWLRSSAWDEAGRFYGALQLYSGDNTVEAWPPMHFPYHNLSDALSLIGLTESDAYIQYRDFYNPNDPGTSSLAQAKVDEILNTAARKSTKFQLAFKKFQIQMKVAIMSRKYLLYRAGMLPPTLVSINALRSLIGEPLFAPDELATISLRASGIYSLRDLITFLDAQQSNSMSVMKNPI